uniref:DEAD-box ATP-dependent RNA helicase 7-like n=1 Tax=Rhizophora mucronata TaxID=61149 RepID=A0A2P2MMK7_RHIMU
MLLRDHLLETPKWATQRPMFYPDQCEPAQPSLNRQEYH